MPTLKPCKACGHPTVSAIQLCTEHRLALSTPKRPERPCTSCGDMTTSKTGMHNRCRPTDFGAEGPLCTVCDIVPTKNKICTGCRTARGCKESPYDLRRNGEWVLGKGRVLRWVPSGTAVDPEPCLPQGECVGFGSSYSPTHGLQRYCSITCRRRADYLRRSGQLAAA